jgi:hypothetical protein
MKNDRSNLQYVFIIPLAAYTISQLITYFFSEVSMLPIFIAAACVFSIIFLKANFWIVNTVINSTIALQLTNVIRTFFSSSQASIWLGVVAISLFLMLSLLPLFIVNKRVLVSISESLLAAGSTAILVMLMQNYVLLEILSLLYPVAVSCIYVIVSNKAEHGIFILISNTISSFAIAYLLVIFIHKIDIISSISVYDAILAITWLSTIGISLLFNQETFPGFKLGYQRFLNLKKEIKADIYTLKWHVTNADQLSNEKLFQVINPLQSIHLKNDMTELLGRTITRYNLQEKQKEMKSISWLLVFSAYLLYAACSLYAYESFNMDYRILLIIGLLYAVMMPYIICMFLTKNMIRYVNKEIINPFNKLIKERKILIQNIKHILLDRGYTERTMEEFYDVYSVKKVRFESKPYTDIDLSGKPMEISGRE